MLPVTRATNPSNCSSAKFHNMSPAITLFLLVLVCACLFAVSAVNLDAFQRDYRKYADLKWPEVVGQHADAAKKHILSQHPELKVEVLSEVSVVGFVFVI